MATIGQYLHRWRTSLLDAWTEAEVIRGQLILRRRGVESRYDLDGLRELVVSTGAFAVATRVTCRFADGREADLSDWGPSRPGAGRNRGGLALLVGILLDGIPEAIRPQVTGAVERRWAGVPLVGGATLCALAGLLLWNFRPYADDLFAHDVMGLWVLAGLGLASLVAGGLGWPKRRQPWQPWEDGLPPLMRPNGLDMITAELDFRLWRLHQKAPAPDWPSALPAPRSGVAESPLSAVPLPKGVFHQGSVTWHRDDQGLTREDRDDPSAPTRWAWSAITGLIWERGCGHRRLILTTSGGDTVVIRAFSSGAFAQFAEDCRQFRPECPALVHETSVRRGLTFLALGLAIGGISWGLYHITVEAFTRGRDWGEILFGRGTRGNRKFLGVLVPWLAGGFTLLTLALGGYSWLRTSLHPRPWTGHPEGC